MDIKTLKKKLALLQQKKEAFLKDRTPKKKRGRPSGSKNKKKSSNKDISATPTPGKIPTPKKRGRPRVHPIKARAYPDLAGTSLVIRKTTTGYIREWVACLDNNVIGYYKYQEDAHRAYLKEANK